MVPHTSSLPELNQLKQHNKILRLGLVPIIAVFQEYSDQKVSIICAAIFICIKKAIQPYFTKL